MPRSTLVLLAVVAVAVLVGAGLAPVAEAERWRRPLPGGTVVGSFSFERSAPYERGRRRGIDLAGRAGDRVVAACGGVVTHAGRVPGFGRGITVRCGRLVATELGLATLAAHRGARLLPGATVGRLGAGGVLRLGARVARLRQGYVDPLALIQQAGAPPEVAPPPAAGGRRPARRRPLGPAAGAATLSAAPVAAVGGRPATAGLPWPVAAGAALLAAGLGGGGAARVRRRRRAHPGIALAQR
jgi:hypothetical protein